MKKLIGILSVIVLLSFTATTGWKTFIGKYEFTQGLMVDTLKSVGTPPVTRGNTALAIVDTNGKFSFIPNGTNGYVMTMVSGVPAWAASSGGGGSTYTFRNSLATGDTILYFPNSSTVVGKTISIANGTNTTVAKSITDSSIVYTVNASGSVSSVGLTMPSGLTVTGSPITTSGTFAVSTTLSGMLIGNGTGFTTATIGGGLSYAAGTLSNAGVTSLAAGQGMSVSGATGGVTISNVAYDVYSVFSDITTSTSLTSTLSYSLVDNSVYNIEVDAIGRGAGGEDYHTHVIYAVTKLSGTVAIVHTDTQQAGAGSLTSSFTGVGLTASTSSGFIRFQFSEGNYTQQINWKLIYKMSKV